MHSAAAEKLFVIRLDISKVQLYDWPFGMQWWNSTPL